VAATLRACHGACRVIANPGNRLNFSRIEHGRVKQRKNGYYEKRNDGIFFIHGSRAFSILTDAKENKKNNVVTRIIVNPDFALKPFNFAGQIKRKKPFCMGVFR
jgi:hypothetical protein